MILFGPKDTDMNVSVLMINPKYEATHKLLLSWHLRTKIERNER